MTVTYRNLDAFHAGIAAMVQHGLTFKADAATLTITLTGGY